MENKFKQVTLRIFKYLPFDKQYVSHATEEMIEYKDKDTNYDYVDFIEIAAVEQLKDENNLLKENLNFWQCNPCEVIQEANKVLNAENEQLKSKIEYANDEIHTLKNKLLMFEGMTFSENQEITALKSKLEVAKKALEFYGSPKTYFYVEHPDGLEGRGDITVMKDLGSKAINALSEIGTVL